MRRFTGRCREEASCEASPNRRDHRQRASRARQGGACIDPRGDDAGKKIKGKKRHVPARYARPPYARDRAPPTFEDRDGGVLLMSSCSEPSRSWSSLRSTEVRRGRIQRAMKRILARVDPRSSKPIGPRERLRRFCPKRWIVERTLRLAWPPPQTRQGLGTLQPQALAFSLLAPSAACS